MGTVYNDSRKLWLFTVAIFLKILPTRMPLHAAAEKRSSPKVKVGKRKDERKEQENINLKKKENFP